MSMNVEGVLQSRLDYLVEAARALPPKLLLYERQPVADFTIHRGAGVSRWAWSDSLFHRPFPSRVTAREALDELLSAPLIERTEAHLARSAETLIPSNKVRTAVLAREYVAEHWPWALEFGGAFVRLLTTALTRCSHKDEDARRWGLTIRFGTRRPDVKMFEEVELLRRRWGPLPFITHDGPVPEDHPEVPPPDVAPLHIAQWLRPHMNRISGEGVGEELVQLTATTKRLPTQGVLLVPLQHEKARPANHCSPLGLGLLYKALQELESGRQTPLIAVPAGKEHHAFVEGIRDWGPKQHPKLTAQQKPVGDETRYELLDPARGVQLDLSLESGVSLPEVVVRALRRLRDDRALRHWLALLRLWAVEGKRSGEVRWTLDQHLDVLGIPKRQREDLAYCRRTAEEVEALTKLQLIELQPDGHERSRKPLIMVLNYHEKLKGSRWELDGLTLQANPLLYHGVRDMKTGRLGRHYWPLPEAATRIAHRVQHAWALTLLLAIRFAWDVKPGRRDHVALRGDSLLQLAGIPYRTHEPQRAWNTLQTCLEELQRRHVIRHWEWAGPPDELHTVCRIFPSHVSLDHAVRGLLPTEPFAEPLPLTGKEFRSWRTERGWTQKHVATELGVGLATVKRTEAKKNMPLSKRMRRALQEWAQSQRLIL